MALDLDEAEQKLALNVEELKDKEAELETTRDSVEIMSAQLGQEKPRRAELEAKLEEKEAGLAATRENVQLLSAQVDQEKQNQTKVDKKLRQQETLTQNQLSR